MSDYGIIFGIVLDDFWMIFGVMRGIILYTSRSVNDQQYYIR